jgi:hypothetical protein
MRWLCTALLFASYLPLATADVIMDYTLDAGGASQGPLNGLAARAAFAIDGTHLSVLLENTSTGVPDGFDSAASLLVSLGINLPGADILSGDAAVIAPGAIGIGAWSDRLAGDSVGEQWVWTNDFGGDLMDGWRQVLSTSEGQSGPVTRFDGGSGSVDGPFGGIAAAPPIISIPANKPAVSNAILFELTLTAPLSEAQLQTAAHASIVEFGSDERYLTPTPEPSALALLAVAGLLRRRR